jgi:hypothetical protein
MKRRVKIGHRNQVAIDDRLIEISGHAVRSYQERFRPTLPLSAARQDLEGKLTQEGVIQRERPHWLSGYTNEVAGYAVIESRDLALPLREHRTKPGVLIAPTCLYRL